MPNARYLRYLTYNLKTFLLDLECTQAVKLKNDVGLPQINQIEINPWHQRAEDLEWHHKYNVQPEAWAPFAEGRNNLFTDPILLHTKYN